MMRDQDRNESVVVVLRGEKGVAPLSWALRSLVGPNDAVLVITIVNSGSATATAAATAAARQPSCFPFGFSQPCDRYSDGEEEYIKFLQQLISERKAGYMQILSPFYHECKNTGVKFQAKIAAGFRPKILVLEEANNAKATWIVMDRGLVEDSKFCRGGFNVALINDNEEAELYETARLPETSPVPDEALDPESPKSVVETLPPEKPNTGDTLPPPDLTCESRQQDSEEKPEIMLGQPVEMGFEEIIDMTNGICADNCIGKEENAVLYKGVLKNQGGFPVLVKRFTGDYEDEIEGELRAASTLSHRNILELMGYYYGPRSCDFVYKCSVQGTLHQYLYRKRGEVVGLTWPERMKITMEIGTGFRYLHEECPGGPVVHQDLRLENIYLTHDLRPVITGFKRARWLWQDQTVRKPCEIHKPRSRHGDLSYEDLVALKSDVFSFGVLLLRMFCRELELLVDDQQLVDWARPLLLKCAFHELLDKTLDELDMYEIYRVMSAAALCTRINPQSRPGMTQVVSILRGDNSCILQFSPSSEGSFDRQFGPLS